LYFQIKKEEKEMKKRVLIFVVMVLSLMLTLSASEVMARSGGSGEGDDCLACWITDDMNPVYQGPLMGWQDTIGAVWLCSPTDKEGNVIPLSRGKTKCEMVIPCNSPYKVGVFERKPTSPSDIAGFCRSGLRTYDNCSSYPATVAAYDVIDSSKPIYDQTGEVFTINIKLMPLSLTNPGCY
jgi:hypothetical protein